LGQSLRILSANLMNGGADPDAFANMVAALDVDLLAVQEVGCDQAAPLAELFEYGEIDPDHNYVGMGLLSRYPVALERIEMTWGFGQTVRLEAGDSNELSEPVEITNIHVAAPHMYSPMPGLYLRPPKPEAGDQNRSESTSRSSATNASAGQGSPTRPGPAKGEGPARGD